MPTWRGCEPKSNWPARPEQDPDPVDASVSVRAAQQSADRNMATTVLASDGKRLRAAVGSMPGQCWNSMPRRKLSLEDLMSGFSGQALEEGLSRGPAAFPIQLLMLLSENAQLNESGQARTAGRRHIRRPLCRRVPRGTDYGPEVFWIDPKSYTLRLVELPTDALRKQIEAEQGPVQHVEQTLELVGARLNEAVPPVAFDFPVPAGDDARQAADRPAAGAAVGVVGQGRCRSSVSPASTARR